MFLKENLLPASTYWYTGFAWPEKSNAVRIWFAVLNWFRAESIRIDYTQF